MRSFLFFLLLFASAQGEKPLAVYLTWVDDPLTTIEVMWLTLRASQGQLEWGDQSMASLDRPLPQLPATLHQVSLKGLKGGQTYPFTIEGEKYLFTMPKGELPAHFIVGGDCYHDEEEVFFQMLKAIGAQKPDFVVFGGDLAYSVKNKETEEPERWITFLAGITQYMRKGEELIPLITAIGNHEVLGGYEQPAEKASLYYTLFPGNGFKKLSFDHYLSLFILDSGHTHPVGGAQTEWLKKTLKEENTIPYRFAIYHVPAYPTFRPYTNRLSTEMREQWVPLFEANKLMGAFEHHDHTLKRTFPIEGGQVVQKGGVVYFGDGTCGVGDPRTPKLPGSVWYVASSQQVQAVWDVTLTKEKALFRALSSKGVVLDTTEIPRSNLSTR